MKKLEFTYSWNNKLDCKAFTTVRIWNEKYVVGEIYEVFLKGEKKGQVLIVTAHKFTFSGISPWMSYLDTGYSVKEMKDILSKMYKKYITENGGAAQFGWYLLKWV